MFLDKHLSTPFIAASLACPFAFLKWALTLFVNVKVKSYDLVMI